MNARVIPLQRSAAPEGKQPPHNAHAEAALLTTCIWEPHLIAEAFSIAAPKDFYLRSHQVIAEALLHLAQGKHPIDEVTIETRMRDVGTFTILGEGFLAGMMSQVAISASVRRHAETVRDKAVLRRLATEVNRIWAECYEPQESPRTLLERSEAVVRELARAAGRGTGETLLDIAKAMATEHARPVMVTAPTGFGWLDDQLQGGLRPGQLMYIGARPETGKTVLGGQLALEAWRAGKRVVFVTMEMGSVEMLERLACSLGQVSYRRFLAGDPSTFTAVNMAVSELVSSKRFHIVSQAGVSALDLEAIATTYKAELVVADYLQLMEVPKGSQRSRQDEVSALSRQLKVAAIKLKIPLVVLCQLSRASVKEKRRPGLTDLRESGSLEQDADIVMLLWRPHCGDPDFSFEEQVQGEFILAKKRRGGGGQMQAVKLGPHGYEEDHR